MALISPAVHYVILDGSCKLNLKWLPLEIVPNQNPAFFLIPDFEVWFLVSDSSIYQSFSYCPISTFLTKTCQCQEVFLLFRIVYGPLRSELVPLDWYIEVIPNGS